MDVIASQGSSLLSVDLSGSDVTDSGLIHLKDCSNLQSLDFNFCIQISDGGLEHLRGTFSTPFFDLTIIIGECCLLFLSNQML